MLSSADGKGTNADRASPDELRAIDEDLAGDVIPQAELPAVYRAAPARGADGRNSRDADRALDAAERFDRLADDIARQS